MNPTIRLRGDGVHIVTYVYEAGTVPSEFADAFSDAARRGVEVRVVIDRNGAEKIPEALLAAWTI